jgi:hypothetical protein
MWRTKELFRALGRLESGIGGTAVLDSFGAGDRARYRFAFRTGPYGYGLGVVVALAPQKSGQSQSSYARLDIANAAGTVVATQTFVYGVNPQGSTAIPEESWEYLKQVFSFVDGLSPDTAYRGTFYDVDYGRIQSACVFELATLTASEGGYLAMNFANRSGIVDKTRENQATICNALWQKGGAQVFSWTVSDGTVPQSTSSSTPRNILDNMGNAPITTVSASTPGWTLDMTGKARLSQTLGVPVTMEVYASQSAVGQGTTQLVDSSGTTILSTTHGPGETGWKTATGVLPAAAAKYDLQFAATSGTLSVYAASVYEYG